jgi:hypothetical protein
MNLNFTKIAGLKDVEIGSQTDVIAVVKDYSDMTTIMTKNNKEVRVYVLVCTGLCVECIVSTRA